MRKIDKEIQVFLCAYNSYTMLYQRIKLDVFVILLLVTCLSPSLYASDFIVLTNLGVDNRNDALSVGFNIEIRDAAPLLDALQGSGTFDVTCQADIVRRRPAMWDQFMGSATYSCQLISNTIARECMVRDARGAHTFAFAQLAAELNRYWHGVAIPLVDWQNIERNNVYALRVTFKIVRSNVSQWLSKPLFFVDWNLVPEIVYELDFEY